MNYLGIEESKLFPVVEALNDLLSDYQVYYQNLRKFHWMIKGPHFFDLHVKFEELYDDAKLKIDEIAERVLTLRYMPLSTLADYLKHAKIKEKELPNSELEVINQILMDHGVLIADLRRVIKAAGDAHDEGTVDMAGSFLSALEKTSWMLDAWSSKMNVKVSNQTAKKIEAALG